MPGIGLLVLIACAFVTVYLTHRYDRTGGTLTLFVALCLIMMVVLALLLAGLAVIAALA